jgi:cell division protein FtsB
MKKNLSQSFLLLALLLMGCSKIRINDDVEFIDKSNVLLQTRKQQINYAETNLKAIGSEIAQLSSDDNFVNFVRTQARKKFDGEYEVLVQDLLKNSTWSSKLNSPALLAGLNAFKNIGGSDGANYYPQIYIPTFQYFEDENISNTANLLAADSIIYIFYAGNEEVDTATNTSDSYPGYYRDANGNLQYWGLVNEEYANTHEVWVFSLNESVNREGKHALPSDPPCLPNPDNPCGGGGPSGGSGGGAGDPDTDPIENARPIHPTVGNPQNDIVNCRLQSMIVKDNKEHWISGASEVAIRAALNCHNNLELGNPSPAVTKQYRSDQASAYIGKLICKVKRKQVRNGTVINANYTLQTGWPSKFRSSDPVYFDYVIFERDLWPAEKQGNMMPGRKDIFWPPFSNTFSPNWELDYRSHNKVGTDWGAPYRKGSLVSMLIIASNQYEFYQGGYVDNSKISFTTVGF